MSNVGTKDMPVYVAHPVQYGNGVHWTVTLPDGPRTYPSEATLLRGLARIGATATFSDDPVVSPLRAPRTTTRSNLRGQGSHSASSSSVPDTRGRSSLAGSLEAGSTVERP